MNWSIQEVDGWETIKWTSEGKFFEDLEDLESNRWVSRGQAKCHGTLFPQIDRDPNDRIVERTKRLAIERKSIDLCKEIIPYFVDSWQEQWVGRHYRGLEMLMFLQHYGFKTRLLDWTMNPYIAAYFAVEGSTESDAELWSFSYERYNSQGPHQWEAYKNIPLNSDIYVRYDMALAKEEPNPDFFMCLFLYEAFPRFAAQKGLFSVTGCFGKNHAESINTLLDGRNFCHRYIIQADLKSRIQKKLRDDFGIWRGSLFPDAEYIKDMFFLYYHRIYREFLLKPKRKQIETLYKELRSK